MAHVWTPKDSWVTLVLFIPFKVWTSNQIQGTWLIWQGPLTDVLSPRPLLVNFFLFPSGLSSSTIVHSVYDIPWIL